MRMQVKWAPKVTDKWLISQFIDLFEMLEIDNLFRNDNSYSFDTIFLNIGVFNIQHFPQTIHTLDLAFGEHTVVPYFAHMQIFFHAINSFLTSMDIEVNAVCALQLYKGNIL